MSTWPDHYAPTFYSVLVRLHCHAQQLLQLDIALVGLPDLVRELPALELALLPVLVRRGDDRGLQLLQLPQCRFGVLELLTQLIVGRARLLELPLRQRHHWLELVQLRRLVRDLHTRRAHAPTSSGTDARLYAPPLI
eukprot:COSAG01_NODE_6250_length_3771_cov_3.280501_1_plen_136_part_10